MRFSLLLVIMAVFLSCNNAAKNNADDPDTITRKVPAAVPPVLNDTLFRAAGTEPFWGLYVIKDQKIIFHPADGPIAEFPFVMAANPDSITTKYATSNGSATLELIITKQNCSDGMSDMMYPYSVTVSINAVQYKGCGNH